MQRVVDGGVRYSCSGCRGSLVGLSPFEREHPADGRRLWLASEAGLEAGGACPFCTRPLQSPTLQNPPPGLAICRRCEQVWVPADAAAAMAAAALAAAATTTTPAATGGAGEGAAPPPEKAHPDECPECGAPWAPDPAGRCRYCREQLAVDQPVLIIERLGSSW